jgi:hypothetical protein
LSRSFIIERLVETKAIVKKEVLFESLLYSHERRVLLEVNIFIFYRSPTSLYKNII